MPRDTFCFFASGKFRNYAKLIQIKKSTLVLVLGFVYFGLFRYSLIYIHIGNQILFSVYWFPFIHYFSYLIMNINILQSKIKFVN